MATFKPLAITNYVQLGKLFKTWALEEDRVNIAGKTFLPKPATVDAFCIMIVDAKATSQASVNAWLAGFDGNLSGIEFVQTTPTKLSLRLPMEQMLRNREAEFAAGGNYLPPDFYSSMFFGGLPAQTQADVMEAHDARVGDYCIAQCG